MELSEHEKNIEWVRALPPMYFHSIEALRALPEYSASMPTGATPGKRWRVNMSFRSGFGRPAPVVSVPDLWVVRQYQMAKPEMRAGKMVEMLKAVPYRPVIRVKAPQEIVTV